MNNYNDLIKTDPEFKSFFDQFRLKEVAGDPTLALDETSRNIAILGVLIGAQAVDFYEEYLETALDTLSAVAIKEVVYQSVAYLGIGRVYPFINVTNKVFSNHNIALPLEGQSTTTKDNRLEKGSQVQVNIWGPMMKDYYKVSTMNRWLAGNCFGDYYTRQGLTLNQRELATFSYLVALGVESQLTSHALGNMAIGNDQSYLIKVVSHIVPYIGYPNSLNAITAINKAVDIIKQTQNKGE